MTSFDPDGDGAEHEDEVGNLVDGDPSTTWRTSSYDGADFAGLKPGVGFVLVLDGAGGAGRAGAGRHQPRTSTPRWSWPTRPARPGPPGARRWPPRTASGADATFDLDGPGRAAPSWCGSPTRRVDVVSIGEVQLTAA